jgi:hypothetical protein
MAEVKVNCTAHWWTKCTLILNFKDHFRPAKVEFQGTALLSDQIAQSNYFLKISRKFFFQKNVAKFSSEIQGTALLCDHYCTERRRWYSYRKEIDPEVLANFDVLVANLYGNYVVQ